MSTRDASLQEVLVSAFDYLTAGMNTIIPGIVLTVHDRGQNRIDVQPALNIRSEDGTQISERPPILNVPLHMPVSKTGGLTYPINVGDTVTLLFSMRGLEIWKRGNGYPSTPNDLRKFDIRDCVAISGLFPFSESPNQPAKHILPHNTSDVVLFHNVGKSTEVEVRLTESGDVRIRAAKGRVFIDSPLTVNQGAIVNGGLVIDGINFGTHKHTGVAPGGSVTQGPVN